VTALTVPYKFQLWGVRQIHRFGGRAAVCDEQGLGKSFQSLLYAHRTPSADPVVVVCPASLKWNWHHEAAAHLGLRADVLEGRAPRTGPLLRPAPVTVVNYDILWDHMEYLKRLRPGLVVVDESSYLAGRTTARARAARHLANGVKHVLALSGTPLVNRPAELWPTLNLVRPDLFPSFHAFAHRYCAPKRSFWGGWDFKGASHLDELHELIFRTCAYRRRKADVLKELPDKVHTVVPLDLPAAGRREYDHALRDFLGWLAEHSPERVSRAARAERLAQLSALKGLAARHKLPLVRDWVQGHRRGTEGKLALFGTHRAVLGQLKEWFPRGSVEVHGGVVGRARQAAVDRFQRDAKAWLFLGNIKAAGMGLTLTAAQTVGLVELPWAPGALAQVVDRAHRIGQKSTVHCYYFVARGTVDEDLLELLRRKQEVLTAVLDGGESEDFDVVEQLTQRMKEKRR